MKKDEKMYLEIQKFKPQLPLEDLKEAEAFKGSSDEKAAVSTCIITTWNSQNYRWVNEFLNGKRKKDETIENCFEIAKVFYEKNKIYIDDYKILTGLCSYFDETKKEREKIRKEKEYWYDRYQRYKNRRHILLEDLKRHKTLVYQILRFLVYSRYEQGHPEEAGWLETVQELRRDKKDFFKKFSFSFWDAEELEEIWKKYKKYSKPFNLRIARTIIADKILKGDREADRRKLKELKRAYESIHIEPSLYADKNIGGGRPSGMAFNGLLHCLNKILQDKKYILLILMFYGHTDGLSFNNKTILKEIKEDTSISKDGSLYCIIEDIRKRIEDYENKKKEFYKQFPLSTT